MITEILGALIVLGAVLVLVMRRLLQKGGGKTQESVEASAARLRYEIERSGDAVIGRMQIHVERLERLLAEANAQKTALDERLSALAQWEKAYGAQLGALPQQPPFAAAAHPAAHLMPHTGSHSAAYTPPQTAPSAAASALATDQDVGASFQAALMQQMGTGAVGGSVDLQLPAEEIAPIVPVAISEDRAVSYGQQESMPYDDHVPMAEESYDEVEEDVSEEVYAYEGETEDTAYEYDDDEEDALYDEEDTGDERSEMDREDDEQPAAEPVTSVMEDEREEGNDAPAHTFPSRQQEQIRAFLRQGLEVEEISQRLGLGLGAIELIRHMERRAQEAKEQTVREE